MVRFCPLTLREAEALYETIGIIVFAAARYIGSRVSAEELIKRSSGGWPVGFLSSVVNLSELKNPAEKVEDLLHQTPEARTWLICEA